MAKAAQITGLLHDMPATEGLKIILPVRVEELWAWGELVRDPQNVTQLHDMRIAAKRLRYLLEFFAPLLGESCAPVLAKFKQLQDYLGDIHDCDVWAEMLQKMQRKEMKREGRAGALSDEATELLGILTTRRSDLYASFVELWSKLEDLGFREKLLNIANSSNTGEDSHGT